jgi:hypothetical protein
MKYRILNKEELTHLEDELKQFLIVNGVHGAEWERLNKEDADKAITLVELFSDSILQKVYEKVNVLEFRTVDSAVLFRFDEHTVRLISIQRKPETVADLSTPEGIHEALVYRLAELEFFRSEKKYTIDRESEVHKLIEQGCLLSDTTLWESLDKLIAR